jgi:uncharacterized OB-fold protein
MNKYYGCPNCGQLIQYEQIHCKHCGAEIEWIKVPQLVSTYSEYSDMDDDTFITNTSPKA